VTSCVRVDSGFAKVVSGVTEGGMDATGFGAEQADVAESTAKRSAKLRFTASVPQWLPNGLEMSRPTSPRLVSRQSQPPG